jgi:O-antigen/teichoic acid export membrane protein
VGPAPAPRTGSDSRAFSGRVAVLFATQVATAGIGIINGFLMARLLGPAAKGDYYLLVLLPATVMVLCQLGLPQALGYFAARNRTVGIVTKTVVLTLILTLAAYVVLVAVFPLLRESVMRDISPLLIVLALLGLPLALNVSFTGGIVLGRQAVGWNAILHVATTASATVLLVLFIGVLGLGVWGAMVAWVAASLLETIGFLFATKRITTVVPDPKPLSYRDLLRYGLPLYPGSITLFFGYRIDVYLLAWLLRDPSVPLGYYSMAVSLAEMVFFLPNSVSTLFFPHVAGSSRQGADRQVPVVSRVTLLLTGLTALAIAPVATILIEWILPAFTAALPALYILLPGVVALSVSKVVSGYVAGLGLTGTTSLVNVGAFVLNVVLNLALIPAFGIVGAATASLVSYTASSVVFTLVGARLSQSSPLDFWLPRRADVRFVGAASVALWKHLRHRGTSAA